MLDWIGQYAMVGFQASMDVSELSVRKNEFNEKERLIFRFYILIYTSAFISTILLYNLVYLAVKEPIEKDFTA